MLPGPASSTWATIAFFLAAALALQAVGWPVFYSATALQRRRRTPPFTSTSGCLGLESSFTTSFSSPCFFAAERNLGPVIQRRRSGTSNGHSSTLRPARSFGQRSNPTLIARLTESACRPTEGAEPTSLAPAGPHEGPAVRALSSDIDVGPRIWFGDELRDAFGQSADTSKSSSRSSSPLTDWSQFKPNHRRLQPSGQFPRGSQLDVPFPGLGAEPPRSA